MKVGISGHQKREGIDWEWVRHSLRTILISNNASIAFSSLAIGSDQIFASEALELRVPVNAVLPFPGYERCFSGHNLTSYKQLLKMASQVTIISEKGDDESLFFEAGKRICAFSDLMVFVWDGKESAGKGGTADIVKVAIDLGKSAIWLDPINLKIRRDGFLPYP